MPPGGATYWPTSELESLKLVSSEGDWKLPGGNGFGQETTRCRTRNNGQRPTAPPTYRRQQFLESDSDTTDSDVAVADDEAEPEESESEEEEEQIQVLQPEKKTLKPPATRVIVEVDALMDTLQGNCRCMECGGPLETMLKTTCIATSIKLACKDSTCGYIFYCEPPVTADLEIHEDRRERSTDFAINILYVVGLLSCGNGCSEAARLLGLLGLPNDTTMEGRSFGIIEERISGKIQQLTNEILLENLVKEVRQSVQDDATFNLWKSALTNNGIVIPTAIYPKLHVSYEMAWQQRNYGNCYASPSGHAVLVGKYSRKPLLLVIKSKMCNYCSSCQKKNPAMTKDDEVPPHDCLKNHEGSSASMEPLGCLEMVQMLFEKWHCIVESICCDKVTSSLE